jgi:hypothetical protein
MNQPLPQTFTELFNVCNFPSVFILLSLYGVTEPDGVMVMLKTCISEMFSLNLSQDTGFCGFS